MRLTAGAGPTPVSLSLPRSSADAQPSWKEAWCQSVSVRTYTETQ